MSTPIPSRLPDRITLAHQRGFLLTKQHRGLAQWQQTCVLALWPFIAVEPYRRKWFARIELDRWRFTELGERCITALASEHTDRVSVAPDYAHIFGLDQDSAELIAGRIVAWVRKAIEESNEVQS